MLNLIFDFGRKFFQKINDIKILFLSFAFFLPINQKISTIIIGLLFLTSLLIIKKEKLHFKRELLLPIILYFNYCISLLYSSEIQFSIIEMKASLIVFPLIFMLNVNMKNYIQQILKYFILGCIVALVICEINAFYHSFDFINMVFNSKIDNNISFTESLTNDKNFFFAQRFSFIHQSVYFSMYLSFAIVILLYTKLFIKRIQLIFIILLSFGIFQTLNKASLIIFLIILIIKGYQLIKEKRASKLFVIMMISIGVILFFINPRLKNFNTYFNYDEPELVVENFKGMPNVNPSKTNTRILIWISALELIKKNPYFGIGAGRSHNRLYEVFAVKKQHYDKRYKLHAHNQYLQILLDLGIVGFIPFLLIFIFLLNIFYKLKQNNIRMIVLNGVLIIGINFLFESMFERYSGLSFFCFYYCMATFLDSREFVS